MSSHLQNREASAPIFHAIPLDKLVREGETVRFECAIYGNANSWAVWDKNGIIPVRSRRITIKETPNMKCLEIADVSSEDAGVYRITVENDYGRVEASARLDVIANQSVAGSMNNTLGKRPITIKRHLMAHSVKPGNQLVLTLQYQAATLSSALFFHNGKEVLPTESIRAVTDKQFVALIIDSVTKKNSGEYCCITQCNDGSMIGMATNVSVSDEEEMDADDKTPNIIQPLPTSVSVLEGYMVDLQLQVRCSVPYTYVWLRNKQLLHDSNEFRYIDHGNGILSLRICDPFVFDSGIYSCILSSSGGKSIASCSVKVCEAECLHISVMPQIIIYPQSFTAVYGSDVAICAHVTPVNSDVKWTVCGKSIDYESEKFLTKTLPDGIHILYITNVNYSLSGEIQCTACLLKSPSIAAKSFSFLTVVPATNPNSLQVWKKSAVRPRFINHVPDRTALSGQNLTLEAFYCGNPEPQVMWMRAGRPIEDSNSTITTRHGCSVLVIRGINANQSGKYTTFILNSFGSDTLSVSVAVEGPPDPPGGQPSISVGPDRVGVAWCGPPYDGGCMISGFVLEMQCDDEEWSVVAMVFDSLSYTVKHLLPGKRYKFRVRAKNTHGYSEPSLPSNVVLLKSAEVPIKNDNFTRDYNCRIMCGEEFKQRYDILEELGRGRFGVVHRVCEKGSARILAAKIIKCIKVTDRKKVRDEIDIMCSLRHPKLLQLLECYESSRETMMVMEFISGGELFERVVADDFTLTEKECVIFIRQICEGVQYMHNLLVVHLDLKPENIMCSTRNSHQIKIIDFGLAQRLSRDTSVRVLLGTPEFVPPEIISYEPIGLQSDMWSVGVICYVLLSGLSPFMGESDVDTFNNITRAEYDFDDDAFDIVSEEAKDFIAGLLQHRKEDRLTASQCLQTRWLSLDNDILAKSKICTNKLKKFIIRRKWQKTGNAIRALGRMASLSASRRNSSVSPNLKKSVETQNGQLNE